MSKLEQFFQSQIDETFMSSDDVVHAVLPLIRQLIETHNNSQVAPMEGIDALHYEHSAIWYAIKDAIPIKLASSAIRRIDPVDKSAFRIVSESSYENDLTDGMDSTRDHSIQNRESKITSPVYLPGYICWENQLEHHDPLCDSFVLGLIIASLACNLNLNGEKNLALFVENRSNLFNINPNLDPVIAKSIVQLTELSRHDRLADLDSLYRSLKNYRDQEIDIDFELLKIQGFDKKRLDDKQQIILTKLQERLFEISRRNKLLHFSSTQQTVNLTQASVPLSCDLQHIRPESLLTWGHSFKNDILKEKPVLLNKYVNTLEALYLPSIFDRLRTEASRDQKEYGFAQLRLVLCFMSWTNLKEKSKERFYSPLVLLPVVLSKKKGIKDKYWLQALDSEAEINPVIRHQFSELFGIDLPETIDLNKTDLVSFYQWLLTKIESSDQSITLELINKPKVDIIHEAAKRRLDQYNRRAGISGRGISQYENIDYSYSPTNFHPLGLRLFNQRIRKVITQLERIVGETDAIETPYMVDTDSTTSESPLEQKKTKAFYSLREDDESNPYRWQFDMCNITLGNFKYRKMSLVKDYARLIEAPRNNQAFEATFSLDPKPVENQINEPTDIAQRYHVVPCDPTQAEAIDLARHGESYIIQGPPGTGKSQTITNLIADYIAHDKKILFVCEKRAAIDIVYLRLKQQGLGAICCLIHDSQTDKKHFIMDLKATYEGFIEDGNGNKKQNSQVERNELIKQLSETLQPLKNFDKHMTQVYEASRIPLNQLLILAMQNKQHLPAFNALALEYFPNYSVWVENQPLIDKLADSLAEIQTDNILLNHPLGLLHERFIELDQPMNRVTQLIGPAQKEIQLIIDGLKNTNNAINLNERDFATACDLEKLLKYIQNVHLLSKAGLTCLFDSSHVTTQQFEKTHKKYRKKIDLLEKCQSKTKHWHNKLPADETETALIQANSLNSVLAFLKPGWWRLRKILNRQYDFLAHQVKPSWLQVLTALQEEHKAQSQVLDFIDDARIDFGFDCDFNELLETVDQTKQVLTQADEKMLKLHDLLVTKNQSIETVERYLQLAEPFERLMGQLNELLQEFEQIEFEPLSKILAGMNDAINQLPEYLLCLRCLAELPDNLSSLFRKHRVSVKGLESAVTHKTLLHIIKTIPSLNRITSSVKNQYVKSIHKYHHALYDKNAKSILDKTKDQFLYKMKISNLPASELTEQQKQLKKSYNKGRRELEHEFGKSIRYKSIRDMVANQSGLVINDLKKVWLMSPLSVSDTLPLDGQEFDVVIFDEASQITLEEAIPSIFRASQSIVVGDQMQLPPTNFFSAKSIDRDDDKLLLQEEGEVVEYDLNSNSFLSHVSNNLVSRRLGWHYRSRSESLISFSNWAFYQGSLLTVPDVIANSDAKSSITVLDAEDGSKNFEKILSRAVSFHWLEKGCYDNRKNTDEADYIAQLVRGLLLSEEQKSIGIVAFSEAQQAEIERAMDRLAMADREFRSKLEEEFEREKDGEFVGLLVKNLENIQGDERDIIIMSICYGYNRQRKMRMNFGPINQKGGEKRLNVAFSRSKQHMVVVSSIQYIDITNDYNEGANALKNYLQYVDAVSVGDNEAASRLLFGLSYANQTSASTEQAETLKNPGLIQIKSALEQRGWLVNLGVGHSRFKCDLAIRKKGENKYRVGLFLDTLDHYRRTDIIERDLLKPKLLENFGWSIVSILAKDWYEDPDSVLQRITDVLEGRFPKEEEKAERLLFQEEQLEKKVEDIKADSRNDSTSDTVTNRKIENNANEQNVSSSDEALDHEIAEAQPASHRDTIINSSETIYLEFVQGGSSNFWSIAVTESTYQVTYGRIGTKGQCKTKTFDSPGIAQIEAEKILQEKLKKGYLLIRNSEA